MEHITYRLKEKEEEARLQKKKKEIMSKLSFSH
jgi:hypothetical protein